MQTIRLARNKPRTLGEKSFEMIWATRLEFRASKEEILSMYVSHAPFGGNVCRIGCCCLALLRSFCRKFIMGGIGYAGCPAQCPRHDSSIQRTKDTAFQTRPFIKATFLKKRLSMRLPTN